MRTCSVSPPMHLCPKFERSLDHIGEEGWPVTAAPSHMVWAPPPGKEREVQQSEIGEEGRPAAAAPAVLHSRPMISQKLHAWPPPSSSHAAWPTGEPTTVASPTTLTCMLASLGSRWFSFSFWEKSRWFSVREIRTIEKSEGKLLSCCLLALCSIE